MLNSMHTKKIKDFFGKYLHRFLRKEVRYTWSEKILEKLTGSESHFLWKFQLYMSFTMIFIEI